MNLGSSPIGTGGGRKEGRKKGGEGMRGRLGGKGGGIRNMGQGRRRVRGRQSG